MAAAYGGCRGEGVPHQMRAAEHPARRTVRAPCAQALARFGYACKGIVYLVMGALAQRYQAISGRFIVYTVFGWVVADCTSIPKLCCNA